MDPLESSPFQANELSIPDLHNEVLMVTVLVLKAPITTAAAFLILRHLS